MVTAAVLVALLAPASGSAKSALSRQGSALEQPRQDRAVPLQVPLPQPRPAGAPARDAGQGADVDKAAEPDQPSAAPAKNTDKSTDKNEAAAPAAPPASACRLALTDELAVAPSIPAIHGPGGCGGDDLVRLEAVVLPDKRKVALTPAAIMRCPMASAVVNWVRSDILPLEPRFGSPLVALDNFDSYECRGRNRVVGAQLSEHGRANALDVRGFKLADGRMIGLTDRTEPRELRETVLHSVCTRFSTVLGPDSDWYHEDHIHLDLMERRNNYRICQWDVLDPMPKVAPLLPAIRPDDAPPRETADAGDKAKAGADADGKAAAPANEPAGRSDDIPSQRPDDAALPATRNVTPKASPSTRKPAVAAAPTTPSPSKSSPSKSSASKSSPSNVSTDKPSATAVDKSDAKKPAAKKRARIHRGWNPFGPFF